MKVAFFSNFLNHHQTPFCEEMVKRLKGDFVFVSTQELPQDRKDMCYRDLSDKEYVLNAFDSEENKKRAIKIAEESEIVIWGDAPIYYLEKRLTADKLTFKYSERYFKRGKWRIIDPRVLVSLYKSDIKYKRNKNLFLLCASAYTASDCAFIGCYKNKAYKWGYFPPVKKYENINASIERKNRNSVLWTGRFIDWKHPEIALYVAKRLKKDGYDFSLNMIGGGKEEESVKRKIEKYGLKDYVKLSGVMSSEEVRDNMEKSEVFLFTSDKNEGWGAVLNESMNSGCAVVANKKIGSVPYLIKNGENGFYYKNKKDLYKKVKFLLDNENERQDISKKAYETLIAEWNAEMAAERLLTLIENIKNGKDSEFTIGPCSKD